MKHDTRYHACCGLVLILLAYAASAAGAEREIASFSVEDFAFADRLPQNVRVARAVPGEGSEKREVLSVEHMGSGSVWVPLFEIVEPEVEDLVWYRAQMASQDLKGRAYLEMWCTLDGKSYFSKGLDDPVQASGLSIDGLPLWSRKKIRFQFVNGTRPEKITLGVRFEGPGKVMIDEATLVQADGGIGGRLAGAIAGVLGGFFGCLCGLWGALAGVLAPRGKARGFVLGYGLVLAVGSVLLLATGIVLAAMGFEVGLWHACVLCGFIGTVVILPLWFVVRRRYRDAELRRMTAMDLG